MLKEPIAEWIRRRIDGWPQQPQDLVMVSWPKDVETQTVILDYLGRTDTGETNTLLERQAAWDFLMDRAYECLIDCMDPKQSQLEHILPSLAVWCMMIAVGAVKAPKWGRGRPSMLSALLARKTVAVVKELREAPARSQQQAIEWVADATGESTDTIVSRLKKASRKPHTFADAYIDNVLEIYGEKIPIY
ncbi:MAG: hypothetical protein F4Z05_05960 [Chloroflexi bacterium]|nr:hypothetical protein [Chloroflexota bacterium]